MRAGDSATGGRSSSDPVAAGKQEAGTQEAGKREGACHAVTVAGATLRYATALPHAGRAAVSSSGRMAGEHSCPQGAGRGRLSVMSTSRTSVRGTRTRIAAVLAALIRIVGGLFVLILVAHVVLTLGDANPANTIARFVAYWANRLQLGFRGLFTPADARVRIVVDYGIAAVVWLVVTWLLVRLVRRLG
jgi:hypothetical protein